uniref:SOCS box domain-containing protein n=1 Tax=Trichogramma kaykai TaxID=54128 RepID=A0ABD2WPK2_9HYME
MLTTGPPSIAYIFSPCRTPLQWAVANVKPYTVESLLNHGADLSSFVLLPENEFTTRCDTDIDYLKYFKFSKASGALAILESLEKRGYKVDDYALIIMKIFSSIKLFEKSTYLQTRWYDDEKFASRAKKLKILPRISRRDYNDISEVEKAKIETAMTPSLSLYDLMRLEPKEAIKILTYWDYHDLVRSKELRRLPEEVMLHLYEKVPRVFCRRWALEYFFELIHYRLPILCCYNIIDQLMNEDLCNICFATTGQDPYSFSFLQPSVMTMEVV